MAYIEGEVPTVVSGGNNGGFGGFGGSDAWVMIILFALIFGWGNNGNGFGGGNGGNAGWVYDINANTNRGFDQSAVMNGINGLNAAVTNGFANAEVGRCNSTTSLLQAMNGLGSQFQNCCCENRMATADLKYTVATENCADRQALSNGIRDIIASNTANTQAILDKLCQQEIDAKNDLISTLRSQLSMADLRASQVAQTAEIRANNATVANQLVAELRSCPIPAQPVYGSQPIFTCNGNGNCNCGL